MSRGIVVTLSPLRKGHEVINQPAIFNFLGGFMKTFTLTVIGIVCWAAAVAADDRAVAEKLRALGGKVTEENGVVTAVSFEDVMKLGTQEDLKRLFAKFDHNQLREQPSLTRVDDVLQPIAQLQQLRRLQLSKCPIRDDQLPLITGLKNLEFLHLEATLLSDDAYKQLTALTQLRTLALYHPALERKEFTGKGLAALKSLPHLEKLIYAGMVPPRSAPSSTYDDGITAIGELTQLKEFQTWHTYQTEAGNAAMLKLTQLKAVKLGGWLSRPPSVTDQTLATLAQIESLESIEFAEARFSASAFSELRKLPSLKKLVMTTSVDIPGGDLETLRALLPGVSITWQPASESTKRRLDRSLGTTKKDAQ
jgi:hypothetical protein